MIIINFFIFCFSKGALLDVQSCYMPFVRCLLLTKNALIQKKTKMTEFIIVSLEIVHSVINKLFAKKSAQKVKKLLFSEFIT